MRITLEGEARELAALVLAVQERRECGVDVDKVIRAFAEMAGQKEAENT